MSSLPSVSSAVLMPYQQQWIADTSPFKVAEKSRRTGLTWAEAADDVLIAASAKAAGGQNVYYIAYNQDMTIEYIEACAMFARAFNYAAAQMEEGIWDGESEEDKSIKTFTIRFPDSGHRIVALTSRPSNLRGRQGVVVIDEAAFHDQLDELLKAAMALLIWGGKVRVISTHNGQTNAFNELITDIHAGKRSGSIHRIDFATAIANGLYRRVCARMGVEWTQAGQDEWVAGVYKFYGDGAAEELDCVPSNGTNAYLSGALIEARSIDAPVLRWSQPVAFAALDDHTRWAACQAWLDGEVLPLLEALDPTLEHAFGQDFGRDHDLTVIAPIQTLQQLRRRVPFVLELRGIPFRQQEQILFFVVDRLPRFTKGVLDARGNGQSLAEFAWQKYGEEHIERLMLSETWYREQMPAFKTAFEDGAFDIPRDVDIRNDLRALKLIKGVGRLPDGYKGKGQDNQPRHADAAIALAIAHYASRQDVVVYAIHRVKPTADLPRAIKRGGGWRTEKGF
ncbi:hypothetical protein L2Y94_06585 [Luteibacter aegosomatis]|uniref:hypothetical protein n=1 Tax=Luteibacter aegosomatis TaxID=2911537 RepID=UPI001FF8EAD5|nr:hypothetical protein [Luteibacter aegosomatis]UPG87018.1 hypothetical protein L2Y94_06585 [Luteibacter aegosomatis]